jgi:uncharacterized membrane protein YphA (DoxX/SURF4 family)
MKMDETPKSLLVTNVNFLFGFFFISGWSKFFSVLGDSDLPREDPAALGLGFATFLYYVLEMENSGFLCHEATIHGNPK